MADTMRAALEAAYEKHSTEEPTGGGTPASNVTEIDTGTEGGGSTQDASQSVGDTSQATPPGDKQPEPKAADAPAADGAGEKPADKSGKEVKTDAEVKPDKSSKPPVSWKPGVREHWAKLPEPVRQEIARRESEIQRGLATAAQARSFQDEFNAVVRPFEGIIRSQNSTPIAAVRNLMTTAAGLTMGSPVQKANIVAEIIQNYGLDIKILDQVLSGRAPKADAGGGGGGGNAAEIRALIAQELAPVREMMNSSARAQSAAADAEVENFAAQNEFADDLAEDMADLLEAAAKRNRPMTMQQAYDAAARSHPEIGPLYVRALAARSAPQNNARANAARVAASSVRHGGPTGGGTTPPTDLRGAISAAYDLHARR